MFSLLFVFERRVVVVFCVSLSLHLFRADGNRADEKIFIFSQDDMIFRDMVSPIGAASPLIDITKIAWGHDPWQYIGTTM